MAKPVIPPGIDPAIYAKTMLMSRPKLNWGWKLEPEQKLSVQLADALRLAVVEDRYKGVWCHIPNEAKRSQIVGMILKAMGMLPGAPDFFFLWAGDGGVIELKTASGTLSEHQAHWRTWCADAGIKHAVCKGDDADLQALAVLRDWNALR